MNRFKKIYFVLTLNTALFVASGTLVGEAWIMQCSQIKQLSQFQRFSGSLGEMLNADKYMLVAIFTESVS